MKKSNIRIFRKNLILLSILSVVSTAPVVQATDVYWNNASGSNQFFDENNWSNNTTPTLNDDLYIYGTGHQTVELSLATIDYYSPSLDGDYNHTLFVGEGSDNSASLNILSIPVNYHSNTYIGGSMDVGSHGGKGVVEYHNYIFDVSHTEDPDEYTFTPKIQLQKLNIGSGLNSDGLVSLTGTGKSASEHTMNSSAFMVRELHVGTDGGKGVLQVDGSSIESSSMGYSDDHRSFTLGQGTDSGIASTGTINILGGGKMMVSTNAYGERLIDAVIGERQGNGTLNIAGSVVKNGETIQSQAVFSQGLEVGVNAGSLGTISVLDGASLSTMASNTGESNISAYIGVDNGNGSVLVSGENSLWKASGHTYVTSEVNEVGHLSIGESGTGSLTIANGGVVSLGSTGYFYQRQDSGYYVHEPLFDNSILGDLYLGNQVNGVGTLNIGGAEGHAPQRVGRIDANQIMFGAGEGAIVFNHTDLSGNYTFTTDLVSSAEGKGTIKQVNGITEFDTDRSLFSGKTEITGGTLVVSNVLGGSMSIAERGTLAGTGIVGTTTIYNGGNISPGAVFSTSPQTLTINGDLTMQSGSHYMVNMTTDSALENPYVSDLLQVNGNAYLYGGGVTTQQDGDFTLYIPDSRWHVLSATGSVTGQFDKLVAMPFVNIHYEYDPQNVYLVVVRNEVSLCQPGMSSNECNLGSNIDGNTNNPGNGDIHDIIVSQPSVETARQSFKQLSGEIHASAKSALLEDSRFLREAVNNRLREESGSEGGAWAHTYGSWGRFNGNHNVADLKRHTGGVFIGVDQQINPTWTAGVMTGYSRANIDNQQRRASAERDDYHVGAYVKGQWDNLSLHTGLGQTWHQYSTDRSINIPGLQDRLTADYGARTSQLFAETRYLIPLTSTITIEPFVDGAYVQSYTQRFTENGGIARLSGTSDTTDMFFTTIGNRFTQRFTLEGGQTAKLWGTVGWRHAYNDVTPDARLNFAGYSRFNIEGTQLSNDVAILEAGIDVNLTQETTVGVMYNGQIGDNSTDHGTKAYFNWHF
ncbi:autotransporter outer membrane beta-barrel domain-containing protein [Budvicia aquatica]|nr:autotransporter domain-containing protein [Budvicia aquatica]